MPEHTISISAEEIVVGDEILSAGDVWRTVEEATRVPFGSGEAVRITCVVAKADGFHTIYYEAGDRVTVALPRPKGALTVEQAKSLHPAGEAA